MLILGQSTDASVDAVADGLRAAGARVLRLDDDDPICRVHLCLSADADDDDAELLTRRGVVLRVREVDACWHHRGALTLRLPATTPLEVRPHRDAEWRATSAQVTALLARRPALGALTRGEADDRLLQLSAARAAGLSIPRTAVVSTRDDASAFLAAVGPAITKALAHGLPGYTRAATADLLTEGVPMLLQARVPRQADLRIFYLDGACWGMAVFPLDPATVDWREAGFAGGVAVPYLPPPHLHHAIGALMVALGLDTGSLDFVLTPDDEAIFLEVNPAGQFGNLACGADLHPHVAAALLARAQGQPRPAVVPPAPAAPPLEVPVVRLHATCTVGHTPDGQPCLEDARTGETLPLPARLCALLSAGVTAPELQAIFGAPGLKLAEALVARGMALQTRCPDRFPLRPPRPARA